jgi:hypothetical protein
MATSKNKVRRKRTKLKQKYKRRKVALKLRQQELAANAGQETKASEVKPESKASQKPAGEGKGKASKAQQFEEIPAESIPESEEITESTDEVEEYRG